jgi:tRNA A37 threonylcarbamoyladenosine synthetase subunit TsaC/SUA5/YrdC
MPFPSAEHEGDTELPPVPEEDLFEGGWELEDIEGVDLILDGGEERERIFSTILDLGGEDVRLLRTGAGLWPA